MKDIYKILKNINCNSNIINQKEITHNILFNINNICNLNCTNCSLICGDRTPFSIEFEDFKLQIKKIADIIPYIGKITLIGGEPMLHPDLLKMCEFIYNNINCIEIDIMSNGILSNKITDKELLQYKQYNVHFIFTIYPKIKIIKEISIFEARCKQFQIPFEIHGIRPCFGLPDFNFQGTNKKEEYFFRCEKSSSPHEFVIFDKKIYNCCLMPAYPDIGLPLNPNDYILIDKVTSFDQLLEFANHPYEGCKYCQLQTPIGEPLHFWHTQDEVPSTNPFKQMYELYLDDYDYYYKLCHTYGEIKDCLQNTYFMSKQNLSDHLTSKPIQQYQKRFFNGMADIFIPFNEKNYQFLIKLKPFILNQINIDKVNLYFVSENSSREIEKIMYFTYPPFQSFSNISIFFLKQNDYLNSFEAFWKNSFLNKIIILNSKNDFINLQNTNNYLEKKIQFDSLNRNKFFF